MAVQFKEEPIPNVEQVDFYVTRWGGMNNIDGFTEKNEMVDAVNLSMDRFPFASPVKKDEVISEFKRKSTENLVMRDEVFRIIEYCGERYVLTQYFLNDSNYEWVALYKEVEVDGVKQWEHITDFETQAFAEKCTDTVWFNNKLILLPYMCYYDFEKGKTGQLEQNLFFVLGDGSTTDYGGDSYEFVRRYIKSSYVSCDSVATGTTVTLKLDMTMVNDAVKEVNKNASDSNTHRIYTITVNAYVVNPGNNTDKTQIGESVVLDSSKWYDGSDVTDIHSFEFKSGIIREDCMLQFEILIKLERWRESWDSWVDSMANELINNAVFSFSLENGSAPDAIISPAYGDVYQNRVIAVEKNNIHVSAQGNANNFGLMTDRSGNEDISGPWFTDVDGGEFVGVKTYQNYVILFQKARSFVLSGNNPPFSVYELGKFGLLNSNAIVECRGILYWASPVGIVAYSGGQPTVISRKLNIDFYGVYGENFILQTDMKNVYFYNGDGKLYCYYPDYDSWQVENVPHITAMMCNDSGAVYYAGKADKMADSCGKLYILHGSEKFKEFEFKTRKFNFYIKERKNVSRIWIRVKMERCSELEVWVSADNGDFERCAVYQQDNDTMFDFKKRIRKCDYVQFMFKGRGNVQIQDLTAKITVGTAKHRSGKNLSVYRG